MHLPFDMLKYYDVPFVYCSENYTLIIIHLSSVRGWTSGESLQVSVVHLDLSTQF